MVTSDEPGYYKSGAYGIRTESLLAVRRCAGSWERRLLEFEMLTLAPIDQTLIEVDQLTAPERTWLNGYHARVRTELLPLLEPTVARWLIRATEAV